MDSKRLNYVALYDYVPVWSFLFSLQALQEAVLRLWRSCPARCAGLWWGASTVPTGDCVQHSEVHLPEHDQPSEV